MILNPLLMLVTAHRIVVEVNVPGTAAYGIVLNNAMNLRRALAPEPVSIEVVCHGEGIAMLFRSGPLTKRIAQAQRQGVTFAACANTLRGRGVLPSRLVKGAIVVPSGVAEVVRKQEAGWVYLKGAF